MEEREIKARKMLGNIISYKRQLKQLEAKIKRIEDTILDKGVAPYEASGGKGSSPKGLEQTYITWITLKMEYEEKYKEMANVIRELEDRIYELNNIKAEYAEILSRYYINGECLESISSDMHYEYRYTKRLKQFAIREFAKIYV